MSTRRTIYLDHSATTPVDPRVVEAMMPYWTEIYGNPSSSHSFGRKAETAVEMARVTIAKILNCKPKEIIFTGCGSESDNIAIRGAAWALRHKGKGDHLITTPVEHSAVIKTVEQMVSVMGFQQTIMPIDRTALLMPSVFSDACRSDTILASVIYANNEVGTINPIADLARIARDKGILFHSDAVQAAGQLSLDVNALGVDMLSLTAHKFYGPKGVGVLYVRDGVELVTSQSGGNHESGRRAGTHNTAAIVGMAKALEIAYQELDEHIAHYRLMRDALVDGILSRVPNAQLTGHPEHRLPSHCSFIFEGIDSSTLLMHLDMKGIAASGASACKTGNPEPSSVLLAMGYSPYEAMGSLRLTVGRQTTMEDVEYTVDVLVEVIEKLYKLKRELAR